MDKLTIIRLLEGGRSQRSVAKELGLNRKTVGRYWKQYQTAQRALEDDPTDPMKKEALTARPTYQSENRKPRKYTHEIDQRVEEILAFDQLKAKQLGPHKQQLTTVAIHEILVSEGFDIAQSTLRPYVREKIQAKKEAYIKQLYPLGYRTEFDFGEVKCLINQQKRTLTLAVFSCPASGYRWGRLYESANQQVFLDAHIRFFEHLKGVYSTVVYDNMRNVVKRFVGPHEKELNDELVKLALYYRFEPVVTNAFSGHEKGHVEKSVQVLRRKAFIKQYEFESIEHAQKHLDLASVDLNLTSTISTEQAQLQELRGFYDYGVTTKQTVDKYSFVHVGGNYYSVPDYLVGQKVTVKRYLNELKIVGSSQVIATHTIQKGEKQYSVDIRHYLTTFLRKPKSLEHSLVLKKTPKLRRCFLQYYQKTPRRFLQFVEQYLGDSIDQLIIQLEEEAIKDQKVFKTPPSRAVNEARNQLQEYNVIHQVRKVTNK
ncbi:TPA_asm: IS21 family transposase [Listeria monocytogenes]|nr:IS21 family transposase [Listeria monocytogenes]